MPWVGVSGAKSMSMGMTISTLIIKLSYHQSHQINIVENESYGKKCTAFSLPIVYNFH